MCIYLLLLLSILSSNIITGMSADENTLAHYIMPATELSEKIRNLEKEPETITKLQDLGSLYNKILGSVQIAKKTRKEIIQKREQTSRRLDILWERAEYFVTDYTTACQAYDDKKAFFCAMQLKALYAPGSEQYESWHRTVIDCEKPYEEIQEAIIVNKKPETAEKIINESPQLQETVATAEPIIEYVQEEENITLIIHQKKLTAEEQLAKTKKENKYKQRTELLLKASKIAQTTYQSEKEGILALINTFKPLILCCDGQERNDYQTKLESLTRQYNYLNSNK